MDEFRLFLLSTEVADCPHCGKVFIFDEMYESENSNGVLLRNCPNCNVELNKYGRVYEQIKNSKYLQ